MTKYREFNIGDLVQIEHGNRPLGIINGGLCLRYQKPWFLIYQKPYREIHKYKKDKDDNYDYTVAPDIINEPYQTGVNYQVYPVLISDVEETRLFEKWYWSGGLMVYSYESQTMIRNPIHDPLVAYIHPSYLTFLAGA